MQNYNTARQYYGKFCPARQQQATIFCFYYMPLYNTLMSDISHPLISVAIPVHNGAAYLGEALRSLLAQTYPHWRLTIHDNASTDDTRAVVGTFADPRIRLVKHDQFVPAWDNWNRCLRDVNGDFFQLLCADDFLHSHYFAEKIHLATMPKYADITLFSSNRTLISKSGKPLFTTGFAKNSGVFSRDDIINKMAQNANPIGDPSTGLVRTSAIGIFQFTEQYPFMVDLDFWLHILSHGKMMHTPTNLSYFRVSGNALSSQFFRNYCDSVRFYRKMTKSKLTGWQYYLGFINFTVRALCRHFIYLFNK